MMYNVCDSSCCYRVYVTVRVVILHGGTGEHYERICVRNMLCCVANDGPNNVTISISLIVVCSPRGSLM